MFGLILLLFSAYLGSSSELDLDIALVGGRQAGRQNRVVAGGVISPLIFSIHCYSSKMLSIVSQILGLGHHYHWYPDITHQHISHHPPSPSPPPLFPPWSIKIKFTSNSAHRDSLVSHIHHGNVNVNQEQLFNFVSHHSLPAYRDCSMEIDCLSENWSSCRYSSYLAGTRTLEIQKIETRNQSEPTFYYGKVSLSAKTAFPNKRLFLWQLSISIFFVGPQSLRQEIHNTSLTFSCLKLQSSRGRAVINSPPNISCFWREIFRCGRTGVL